MTLRNLPSPVSLPSLQCRGSKLRLMVKLFLALAGVMASAHSFAQNETSLLYKSGKFLPEYIIITPLDSSKYQLETFFAERGYWLIDRDTLYKQPSGDLKSDSVIIKHVNDSFYLERKNKKGKTRRIDFKKVDHCNAEINRVKNSHLFHDVYKDTHAKAKALIGYGNNEYTRLTQTDLPLKELETKCHSDFLVTADEIKNRRLSEIRRIYDKKVERYEWFSKNIRRADTSNVRSFLVTYDDCDTDKRALYLLLVNRPELFIRACNKLKEMEFFMLKLQMDDFPKDIDLKPAIASLEKTGIRSKRKNKVIRKLRRIAD